MSTLKKTIVLSNKTNLQSNAMAVLSIENMKSGVFATLKAYNISDNDKLVLGISCNNKPVVKKNINLKNNNTYNFKVQNYFNLDEKIGCVLVYDADDKVTPIVWGTSGNEQEYKSEIVRNLNNAKYEKKQTIVENVAQLGVSKNEKEKAELFESNCDEVEKLIDEECLKQDIQTTVESMTEENEEKKVGTEKKSELKSLIDSEFENEMKELQENEYFYDLVKDQIQDLFSKFPKEENLENLIPNSKWVKVDFEDDGNVYVLGLIYEDGELRYICYGVPGQMEANPPTDMAPYSQWLPINANAPDLGGYWVMYQDAKTGDSLEIDVI